MTATGIEPHGQTGCRRCGTCCEKGGPSLHLADKPLVVDGQIPARCLFTLRKGERVRDNVAGTLVPLEREIVKIRGGTAAGPAASTIVISGAAGSMRHDPWNAAFWIAATRGASRRCMRSIG